MYYLKSSIALPLTYLWYYRTVSQSVLQARQHLSSVLRQSLVGRWTWQTLHNSVWYSVLPRKSCWCLLGYKQLVILMLCLHYLHSKNVSKCSTVLTIFIDDLFYLAKWWVVSSYLNIFIDLKLISTGVTSRISITSRACHQMTLVV